MRSKILVILILVFSFLIRIYQLDINPAGFFCDEALRGIDALSIIEKGKDTNGESFPLFFRGFYNDAVSPFNVYPLVITVGLFGLKEISIRIVPVILSVVGLFVFYRLINELINTKIALIATLILSISPWSFHISRIFIADFEFWPLLTLISYYFFIKTLNNKKVIFPFLASFFLGLTTYSYYPARLITPILFLSLTLIMVFIKNKSKSVFIMILVYPIMLLPLLNYHLRNPGSLQRFTDTVGVPFENKTIIKLIKDQRKVFFNKFKTHYSNDFLFTKGDASFPQQLIKRHSITDLGLLYPYQKWLIIIGLIWLFWIMVTKKRLELVFVIFLLVLFPLADSLTYDKTPFATRSYLGVLPFHILIAFGILAVYQALNKCWLLKKPLVKIILSALLIYLIVNSTLILLVKQSLNPLFSSDFWGFQAGPREIISYFKQVENNYDELYMEPIFNAPSVFFKFYAPDSCYHCFLGNLDNYNPEKKQLFALSNNYLQTVIVPYNTVRTVYYPNGEVAFKIIEIKNL